MDKKTMRNSVVMGLALFNLIVIPISWVHAAEEIDAYCVVPKNAVPHGSTVALTIKFSDSDKSNDLIVQGPFKILKYVNGKAIMVDFKRDNDKDDKGKKNLEKPTLSFSVTLSPKHKLLAPATESVTFTYFVKHKEGKRGELFTTEREQQVDCSFTVQHETDESLTPSGGREEDNNQKNIGSADLGIDAVGILPTSRFYFLKEWRRGISRFFTFSSVKKVELELRITNEKAGEALKIQETNPDDAEGLTTALKNYTSAGEQLQARLEKLRETSENLNIEKLFKKLNEQTLKHALLLNQLAQHWTTDPYVEEANVLNPQAARDNHLQGAVDIAQKKIQDVVLVAAQKEKNIEQKAVDQIARAESEIKTLESQLAEFAINEPGVPNEKTGPVRLDPTPARTPKNSATERQTPKRDFGDRMKAGLETAGGILRNAKKLLQEGKFGEAFGQARSAEVLARNTLRVLGGVLRADTGGLEDEMKRAAPQPSAMPVVPSNDKKGEVMVPEVEKKVFLETNNRVFPETSNRTVCDDGQEPACLRGEVLECRGGVWKCIGPATSGGQILNPTESPSTNSSLLPTAKDTGGYSFEIIGYVYDATDALAMTNGTPVVGIVLGATGPKTFTTQTRANGSYTLSFTGAPLGTYDVCVTLPPGYTMNPPSGCTSVIVRLSEKYDKTLELINNGNLALHWTAINFHILRQ